MNGYIEMCYKSALKAFNELCDEGHSGMSIQITKSILCRLIDGKPLTEIEDTPDVWAESRTEKMAQNIFNAAECRLYSKPWTKTEM